MTSAIWSWSAAIGLRVMRILTIPADPLLQLKKKKKKRSEAKGGGRESLLVMYIVAAVWQTKRESYVF